MWLEYKHRPVIRWTAMRKKVTHYRLRHPATTSDCNIASQLTIDPAGHRGVVGMPLSEDQTLAKRVQNGGGSANLVPWSEKCQPVTGLLLLSLDWRTKNEKDWTCLVPIVPDKAWHVRCSFLALKYPSAPLIKPAKVGRFFSLHSTPTSKASSKP